MSLAYEVDALPLAHWGGWVFTDGVISAWQGWVFCVAGVVDVLHIVFHHLLCWYVDTARWVCVCVHGCYCQWVNASRVCIKQTEGERKCGMLSCSLRKTVNCRTRKMTNRNLVGKWESGLGSWWDNCEMLHHLSKPRASGLSLQAFWTFGFLLQTWKLLGCHCSCRVPQLSLPALLFLDCDFTTMLQFLRMKS